MTVTATDIAGNTSTASAALSVTIDTAVPCPPSRPDLTAASDTGISSTDDITNVTTPTFVGTAAANSRVRLFDGTTQIGSTVADGSGNWSITASPLTQGTHSITATATDIAGNESLASAALSVTLGTTAPTAPPPPALTAASHHGSSSTAQRTNALTPTFVGTAAANSRVRLFSGTTPIGGTVADGSGNWSITSAALAQGTHSITVTATDIAGN